jgi:hypothetical protein
MGWYSMYSWREAYETVGFGASGRNPGPELVPSKLYMPKHNT